MTKAELEIGVWVKKLNQTYFESDQVIDLDESHVYVRRSKEEHEPLTRYPLNYFLNHFERAD